jgi:hypothetical protein
MKHIEDGDLIKIHQRLDVHKEVIGMLISYLQVEIGHANAQDLVDMLDESQNHVTTHD